MSHVTEDRSGVQVVRRVVQILSALRDDPAGLSLSQIASRTGLARSTVHRLVNALESEDFVSSASPSGRFRLGSAVAGLAQSSNRDVVLTYHPLLSELSRTLNETVDLAVLEYDQVRFVHQVAASQHRLRAVSAIGALFPAYCTANGRRCSRRCPTRISSDCCRHGSRRPASAP
jgi:DNA-binding IclR family transcriptional regulator